MQQTSTFTNDNFSKGPRMSSENRVVFSAKLLFANHCLSFLSSLILNWTENQKEVILIKNKKIWKYFLLKIQQKTHLLYYNSKSMRCYEKIPYWLFNKKYSFLVFNSINLENYQWKLQRTHVKYVHNYPLVFIIHQKFCSRICILCFTNYGHHLYQILVENPFHL